MLTHGAIQQCHMTMHLERDRRSDVKVEDVVDIARAAGHAIMEVYNSDSEVGISLESISRSIST